MHALIVAASLQISVLASEEEFAYCTMCHGAQGNGNAALRAPKIAGMEPWYVERQLLAFAAGWRGTHPDDAPGAEMRAIAVQLANERAMPRAASYVMRLEPLTPARTLEGNARRGARLYEPCIACHGAQAEGNEALGAPALARQSDWYLAAQLESYRAGWRGVHPDDVPGTQMRSMAEALPHSRAIADVVAHITRLGERPGSVESDHHQLGRSE